MGEALLVFAIAVAVIAVWLLIRFLRQVEPTTRPLEIDIKPPPPPQDFLETIQVRLEELLRWPKRPDGKG